MRTFFEYVYEKIQSDSVLKICTFINESKIHLIHRKCATYFKIGALVLQFHREHIMQSHVLRWSTNPEVYHALPACKKTSSSTIREHASAKLWNTVGFWFCVGVPFLKTEPKQLSDAYTSVLKVRIRKMYKEDNIFMRDGAPCHRSKHTMAYLDRKKFVFCLAGLYSCLT